MSKRNYTSYGGPRNKSNLSNAIKRNEMKHSISFAYRGGSPTNLNGGKNTESKGDATNLHQAPT